jgi:hypothetical protein
MRSFFSISISQLTRGTVTVTVTADQRSDKPFYSLEHKEQHFLADTTSSRLEERSHHRVESTRLTEPPLPQQQQSKCATTVRWASPVATTAFYASQPASPASDTLKAVSVAAKLTPTASTTATARARTAA